VALFQSRDRAGSSVDFRGNGTAGGFLLVVGAVTAVPTVLGFSGDQSITTAQALPSIPANSSHALMTVDSGGGDIRFREDTSNPTTTSGLLVPAGNAVELTNLSAVRIIATTGTVKVNISYRRYDA